VFQEGVAECIANEDGERQIACAISFNGEEIVSRIVVGLWASGVIEINCSTLEIKQRINLSRMLRILLLDSAICLGKSKNMAASKECSLIGCCPRFSEIPQSQKTKSTPVIQHPHIPDEPAYKVQILQPAPTPLPRSTATSNFNTPAASHAATPRSEPIPAERILTVSEVTTMFISSLVESAEDFLGKKVEGAVITVPMWFNPSQKDALEKATRNAGVPVLQLLDEAAAAAVTTTSDLWSPGLHPDCTQLIVDLGASSLSLSLLSIRSGLAYILTSSTTPNVGGDLIDDKLIKFFAADFTKKTKTPLSVCPSTSTADARAESRLRLAIEHTKRTISASPGAATCSVESLKDGLDYTGSINRMRFDMVVRSVYQSVSTTALKLLENAAIDAHDIDEIVYVGGSTCLPGLDEQVVVAGGFREDVETPFMRGTIVGGGVGDPTTVLARGCALQAALVASIPNDGQNAELLKAFRSHEHLDEKNHVNAVRATSRTVGILCPDPSADDKELGGTWIPVVQQETALPARRTVAFDVRLTEESKRFAFEVWEVKESIHVEKVVPPKLENGDAEDAEDEQEEELEVKHRVISKEVYLGAIQADALLGIKVKGKTKDAGKWTTTVEVQFTVELDGSLKVDMREIGTAGATGSLRVLGASS
jgi:molecular chaperone DnaK (HSP70)